MLPILLEGGTSAHFKIQSGRKGNSGVTKGLKVTKSVNEGPIRYDS
jgi:hypothetical protein